MGTAAAIVGGSAIAGGLGLFGASKAAKASKQAAQTEAQAQMAQLEYLKEVEALPRQFREEALRQMSERVLEPGGRPTQAEMIEQAKASPLYGAIMGGREAGEEAILRQAGATGGLRSGTVQAALAGFASDLQNQALLQAYQEQVGMGQRELAELQGLAGLPSMAPQIGQTMANIGATKGAGQIAAGKAWQSGLQTVGDVTLAGLGMGLKAGII